MFNLPPWPGFDRLHPLVVHFPIALFLVAPVFVIAAILLWRQRIAMIGSAATLLVLGAAGLFVTVASGEAAGEVAQRSAAVNAVLERHEELAETTRVVFTVLTALLVVTFVAAIWLKERIKRPAFTIGLLVYVLVYAASLLLLVNTAHQGGRLVHELGVRSAMAAGGGAGGADVAGGREHAQARDD
jgi:uncharacterized membrane protein